MQTILGSGGAIGKPLALELAKYTGNVRLVARNPQKVNATDELFPADLTNKELVDAAVKGSEVVYLAAGLEYKLSVWQRDWPRIMENVIEACVRHKASLVFFDNVYMYAPEEIPHMTEKSRVNPCSEKGKVRATLEKMIFDATRDRQLHALIARSADFYGPAIKTSMLKMIVVDNFLKGKKAMWQMDATKIHSFTNTEDAAKATAQLGNTPDAYGQVWHLPTSPEKLTGREFIEMIAAMMGTKPRYTILNRTMCTILGIFIPVLRELKEMMYQNDRDYFFDSSKFEQRFGWGATPYRQGIKVMVEDALKEKAQSQGQ
ncbi:NAD-dependent epimerase/dehydratase family protein [Flavihumibacter profundi]|uniref:NAD-dependent epimerase/dehydratase family protein n=1 Tax=Flavihumibacter profundi TaxID=2716883 RepID=UPI001CC52EF4|nr:NAD-dependent epimerase/dehydratase family protein [Flavihumibacter profundi]MBZ5857780.1 NAD-dependent epimerase/dehydratase family protein [Flavihumibacter profundi]